MTDYTGTFSTLEIYLDRIAGNYLSLQKRLIRGADCAAVVKADCYGLGVTDIVPELYKANCRHFYVAHASEGFAVRKILNSLSRFAGEGWGEGAVPQKVFSGTTPSPSPLPGSPPSPAKQERENMAQVYAFHGVAGIPAAEVLENNIIPVLNSLGDIEQWSALAKQNNKKLPAVIHIDTGMNRLGLGADEVERLKKNIDILQPLDVRYIMSHLACADETAHPKNREQLIAFKKLTASLGLPCRLSFANSGGIFLGNDYHFDQARPGCSLYGITPQVGIENPMLGVVTLKARILQIRDVAAGETVGYGARFKASSPIKLATISVGYADGILRCIGEKGTVAISGQKCSIAGRVSMDTIIVNVTDIKPQPQVGDWAEVIGPHQPVDDVAAMAGTIGYEILTSIGRRYKRVYTRQEQI